MESEHTPELTMLSGLFVNKSIDRCRTAIRYSSWFVLMDEWMDGLTDGWVNEVLPHMQILPNKSTRCLSLMDRSKPQ